MPRIRQPIFIDAFAGGGSNLLWNVLQSHPRVCSPVWETHELFQRGLRGRTWGLALHLLSRQPRFFSRQDLSPRLPLRPSAASLLHRCLHRAKMDTLGHPQNRFRAEGIAYTAAEVRAARIVCKNLDGLALAAPALAQAFEGAVFFGLVRHGLAVLEGAHRRGAVLDAGRFGAFYRTVAAAMLSHRKTLPEYHLLRFEDLLRAPEAFVQQAFRLAGLEQDAPPRIRLKAKPHFNQRGVHGSRFIVGEKVWLWPGDLRGFLEPGVDQHQIRRLPLQQRRQFMREAGEMMEALGYHDSGE